LNHLVHRTRERGMRRVRDVCAAVDPNRRRRRCARAARPAARAL